MFGAIPETEVHARAFLLGGPVTAEDVGKADVKGKVVLLVLDYSKPLPPTTLSVIQALQSAGAAGIVSVSNRDSTAFATRLRNGARVRLGVDGMAASVRTDGGSAPAGDRGHAARRPRWIWTRSGPPAPWSHATSPA